MVVVVRDGCGWQEIRLGLKIGEDENRKWRFHVCVFLVLGIRTCSLFFGGKVWDSGRSPPKVKIYFLKFK